MNTIKTPSQGMCDYLPSDMRLREYVLNLIKTTYAGYGFSQIETPCVEHIENLTSKQGGDNEKLIFKIMKRGEKLIGADTSDLDNLVDSGLRYDLTVPLARYYANNAAVLPSPFKALQIGNVWRAERPQKGRFRQFVQCDIDILGDSSSLCEIELVSATTAMLSRIGFKGFRVRINDRGILRAMALSCGFPEDACEKVFITVDKMDKIGLDGVKEELIGLGFAAESVEKYAAMFEKVNTGCTCAEFCAGMGNAIDPKIPARIDSIMHCVRELVKSDFTISFDPTLVRGMSYYTGAIFEVGLEGYNFSIAGGGRYDEMIGKFSGQKVPACGFSIGFERIITILKDRGFTVPGVEHSVAFLVENGLSDEKTEAMFAEAAALRAEGARVVVTPRAKNARFQREKLAAEGYTEFKEFFNR